MGSPKKNFIYNLIYQLLILIIPLITAPYLARIVGAEGVGIYSYTYSIVYYFMLFVLLGVNNYGNRSIAKVREDKKLLSKTFLEIYTLQLFLGVIMILFYFLYIYFVCTKYINIAYVQSLFLFSAVFDINWFFFGIEEFKKTIVRNTFVKIVTVVLILLFVKCSNDLWKYTLIMSGMTLMGQVILWGFLKKKIVFQKVSFSNVINHIKPNLVLFVPVIAVSLYKIMDKIMLGFFSSMVEVGFYENAEKIVNIPMTFISALGTVMLPRISNIVASGDDNKIEQYIEKSINFVMFTSFAMCFGLICIGKEFAPIYFGKEFEKTGFLIILLSITLPFLSFANVIRTQYLIPKEKDNIYLISVILGATSNLILNLIFIPKYHSLGACFGTIFAEFIVMAYQTLTVRKELPIINYLKHSVSFFKKGIIMLVCIYPICYFKINTIIIMALQIFIGGLIYLILNIKYIKSIIKFNK